MAVETQFCDFCLRQLEHSFTHYADRFFLPGDDSIPAYVDTDGEWAVCPACHAFIVAGDEAGLKAHTAEAVPGGDATAFFANYHNVWREDTS